MTTPDYEAGIKYWSSVDASYDGVLGGFGTGSLPQRDALGSRTFLRSLIKFEKRNRPYRALDCGAGIGRVTKDVLTADGLFDIVDLVEPVRSFSEQAEKVVLKELIEQKKVGTVHTIGLQSFEATEKYDVIWCQWCLGHLSDTDLVAFFKRCREWIKHGGYLVVKENLCIGEDQFDESDSSITRSDESFKRIFSQAGYALKKEQVQFGLPKGLFTVKAYAMQ